MTTSPRSGRTGGWYRRAAAVLTGGALLLTPLGAAAAYRGRSDHDRGRPGQEFRHREQRHEQDFRNRYWHFEPRRGWHYEHRPGHWSPFYVRWWREGRTVLALPPDRTVVHYPRGYYQLRGDGFNVPYCWVWVPLVRAAPPPPPVRIVPAPGPLPPRLRAGSRETGGMIVGGTVGGLIGSTVGRGDGRTAGIIVGALVGALVGRDVGRSLDQADELRAARILETNRTGQASTWVNPDSGTEVTMMPTRTYQENSGEYCREYQADITVGGEKQQAYGTACRQPDGEWKLNP